MRHYDYDWDLEPEWIKFDKELDIDKLGWKHGDYFRITNVNGQAMLVKVDPVVKFLKDGARKNEQMESVVRESTGTY
jgi:anaerobic selenocysteine-containing dehydrogenase